MSIAKSDLLGGEHVDTEIKKVIEKLAADDRAYFDERKNIREVPVFAYGRDNEPIRITHWQKRQVAPPGMSLAEAESKGLDYYHEERGWIRRGKKAERDFQE